MHVTKGRYCAHCSHDSPLRHRATTRTCCDACRQWSSVRERRPCVDPSSRGRRLSPDSGRRRRRRDRAWQPQVTSSHTLVLHRSNTAIAYNSALKRTCTRTCHSHCGWLNSDLRRMATNLSDASTTIPLEYRRHNYVSYGKTIRNLPTM